MSDISFSFPPWITPLLIGLLYWPLLLLAAAILAGLAMFLRGWRRAGLLALAGITVLPCLMVLGMDVVSGIEVNCGAPSVCANPRDPVRAVADTRHDSSDRDRGDVGRRAA